MDSGAASRRRSFPRDLYEGDDHRGDYDGLQQVEGGPASLALVQSSRSAMPGGRPQPGSSPVPGNVGSAPAVFAMHLRIEEDPVGCSLGEGLRAPSASKSSSRDFFTAEQSGELVGCISVLVHDEDPYSGGILHRPAPHFGMRGWRKILNEEFARQQSNPAESQNRYPRGRTRGPQCCRSAPSHPESEVPPMAQGRRRPCDLQGGTVRTACDRWPAPVTDLGHRGLVDSRSRRLTARARRTGLRAAAERSKPAGSLCASRGG